MTRASFLETNTIRSLSSSYFSLLLTSGAAFFLILVVLAIVYPNRVPFTKNRPDLPGPRGHPILGNTLHILPYNKRSGEFMASLEERFGELCSFTMFGWGRSIIVDRVEWIEHIRKRDNTGYGKGSHVLDVFAEFPGRLTALGSEAEQWKLSRKIIHPFFTPSFIEQAANRALNHTLPIAHQLLRSCAESGSPIDFDLFCGHLTLDVLLKILIDVDLGIITPDPACLTRTHELYDAVCVLSRISSRRLADPLWKITEHFTGERRTFNQAHNTLHTIVGDLIQQRRTELAATNTSNLDDDSKTEAGDFLGTCLRKLGPSNPNSDSLIKDAIITLIFAGRDNNQSSLNWSLYEMCRDPERVWEGRLVDEARRNNAHVLGNGMKYGDTKVYSAHQSLLHETLRMYPGVPKNARVALADDLLPPIPEMGIHDGVKIGKGDYVIWLDTSMMKNPKIWGPTAHRFDPARFMDEKESFVKPSVPMFHAFGMGARMCPGALLAALEFTSIWSSLLPAFTFEPVDKREHKAVDALTLTMDGPFEVWVRERAC